MFSLQSVLFYSQLIWVAIVPVVFLGLIAMIGFIWLIKLYWNEKTDPLRNLDGIERSFFQGGYGAVVGADQAQHNEWVEKYGRTFRFNGFGRHDYRLVTSDIRALSYILNSPIYEKPWQTQRLLSNFIGQGLSIMEGEGHGYMRKIASPAFTTANVRRLYCPIFVEKAAELCDVLHATLGSNQNTTSEEEKMVEVDVIRWVGRATLDVIGLASFDYDFNGLRDESQSIYKAYNEMFEQFITGSPLDFMIQIHIPWITKFRPTKLSETFKRNMKVIHNFGQTVIQNKKQLFVSDVTKASHEKETSDCAPDLLSRLIEANINPALHPSQRLDDTQLMDQINNFLFAGSESSGIGICWCLNFLAKDVSIQNQLREEIRSVPSNLSPEEYSKRLDSLPYLDAVVKETLRLSSPVHSTIRAASQDDVIPLSDEITLKDGSKACEIRIRKGTYIHIPLEGFNIDTKVWGEDALLFKPGRWSNLPASAKSHPGLGGVLSFSMGGHSCIGWKFAFAEIKIFLATLISQFVFTPSQEIRRVNAVLQRPYVKDKWEEGYQMPLHVRVYTA